MDTLQLFLKSSGICTDTRAIYKDCLFVALSGTNFNGNAFAQQAIDSGALYALVDQEEYADESQGIYLVEDSLKALQSLANTYRKSFDIPFIGITGTNGKTTSKELIYAVLSSQYKVHATKGNLNNHIGVPLTLLSIPRDTEIAIIEMGANHVGEIAALCNIAEPTHGIITNIGKAHLEGFGGVEGVIKAKTELYQYLIKRNHTVFINNDDQLLMQQELPDQVVSYGNHNANINYHINESALPFAGINLLGEQIQSQLIGSYNATNMAAAACIGSYFNVSSTNIKMALESYLPSNQRSQLIKSSKNTIVLDAYNANPSSMGLAIEDFKNQGHDHKIAILGDMFELGEESKAEHQKIANQLSEANIPAILIGKHFAGTTRKEGLEVFDTTEDYITHLEKTPITNSLILIKGSRGMALERLLEYIP